MSFSPWQCDGENKNGQNNGGNTDRILIETIIILIVHSIVEDVLLCSSVAGAKVLPGAKCNPATCKLHQVC